MKIGEPAVNEICALAYDPLGIIYFRTHAKEDYKILPHCANKKLEFSNLNLLKNKISKKKWQHLQDLKLLLPSDCH